MPSRYRWGVLAIGVVAQAALSSFHQGLPSIGPALLHHFHVDLVATGALLSAVAFGVAVGLTPWGVLADRWGERLVLSVGLTGAALALAVAALVPGYAFAFAALVAAGALGSCANAASGRAVMAWFAASERGTALGVRQMATPLGGGVAALTLPWIALRYGVGAAFWALSAFCLLAAIACAAGLRRGEPRRGAAAGSSPLRDLRIWRLAAGGSLIVAGQLSLIAYLVIFLSEYRHWPLAAAALVLTGCQLAGAVARVTAGAWSDRLSARIRPMRWLALAGAGLLGATALVVDAPLAVTVPLVAAATVVNMSTNGLAFTATGEIAGTARAGSAMGFQNTLLFISGGVSPILFGAIVSSLGWRAGFAFLVVTALAGWLLLSPLVEQEARGWRAQAA
jgi:sugar phosphate permease